MQRGSRQLERVTDQPLRSNVTVGFNRRPFRLFEKVLRDSFSNMRVEAVNSLGVAGAGIEFPWRDAAGQAYLDLRENSNLIGQIESAGEHAPLAGFLGVVNGEGSLFNTIRAKVWAEPPPKRTENPRFTPVWI